MIPFTTEQFLNVFAEYNRAVWPAQIVLYALALCAVVMTFLRSATSNRLTSGILSFFWLWSAVVYHWLYFSKLNKLAVLLGGLFVLQSLLLFSTGVIRRKLSFRIRADLSGLFGALFVVYALVIYPLLGLLLLHKYPRAPTFGVPCPITIFTLGILLWTEQKPPWAILIIPLVWSLFGLSAVFLLGMREDVGLAVAGLITLILVLLRNQRDRRSWESKVIVTL